MTECESVEYTGFHCFFIGSQRAQKKEKEMKNGKPNSSLKLQAL